MKQLTLYRHADGILRDQPERAPGGKITQRYCAVRAAFDGTRIFERVAEIPQRSLASVGGIRPGCNFTKLSKRKAARALPLFPLPPKDTVQYGESNLYAAIHRDRSKYTPKLCAASGKR